MALFFFFVEPGFDRGLDLFVERGVVFQRVFAGIATLGKLSAFVAEPRASLLDNLFFERKIEERAGRGNPLVVHDVDLRFGEWRRDFVLHHFHARPVAGDNTVRLFDRANPANIDADARVKLQSLAARRRLGIAEHHADLFADLIGENAAGPRLGNQRGQFAHRGAHQTRLRTDRGVADLALEFLFRDQRGDGIEDDDVERVGADERLDDPKRFFAGARLRDEQVVHVDAEPTRVLRIERVLDVDERRQAAALLGLGDDRKRERRFARRFRPIDFDDAAPRKSTNSEGAIDQDVAGRNDIDVDNRRVAEPHDSAVAVVLRDLLEREIEVFVARRYYFVFDSFLFSFCSHRRGLLVRALTNFAKQKSSRKTTGRKPWGLRPA